MATQDPKKQNLLYLEQIALQDVPNREYTLRLFVENVEQALHRKDNHTWTPEQRQDISPTSQIRVDARMKSGHSVWAKYREASEVVDLHGLFNDYWSSNNHEFTVMKSVVIGKHSGSLEVRFSANDTVDALRSSLHELEGLLEEYSPLMSGSVEKSVDRAIKYGAVFAELNPIAKAVFGVASVTFELLKEQNKYDQMPSGLCDRVQRILPLAKQVADEIVSEETKILKELIPRMFEVMHRVAKVSCDYVKRARTIGSPAYQEMIEEMDRELNNIIEDFDRAVDVETLRIANETKRAERERVERVLEPVPVGRNGGGSGLD